MNSVLFVVAVFFIVLITETKQKNLPSFIKRCKYTTDRIALGECVKNTFNENKDKFISGIPEMHIPVLDPFVVERIDFNTGNGSAIGINAIFKNVKVEGTKEFIIDKLEADIPNRETFMELHIPTLRITSEYVMNGRIMILPINGSGTSNGNFTNLHTKSTYKGKIVTRNNKEYIEWTDQTLDLTVGGMTLYFDDLFNGNKELTESTNKVINENSGDILKELKPLVDETISTITFTIIQRVFHTFSIDELFEK